VKRADAEVVDFVIAAIMTFVHRLVPKGIIASPT
jgi:hypothetical protein